MKVYTFIEWERGSLVCDCQWQKEKLRKINLSFVRSSSVSILKSFLLTVAHTSFWWNKLLLKTLNGMFISYIRWD